MSGKGSVTGYDIAKHRKDRFFLQTYPDSMVYHEVHSRAKGVQIREENGRTIVAQSGYSKTNSTRMKNAAAKLFLTHCEEAREKLVQIMHSEHSTAAEQLRAAIEILDRGQGKPVDMAKLAEINKDVEGPAFDPSKLKGLPPAELRGALAVIAMLKGTAEPVEVNQVKLAPTLPPDSSGGQPDCSGGSNADQVEPLGPVDEGLDDFLDG